MADLTHLRGAVAQTGDRTDSAQHDHWGGEPIPRHVRVWHEMWAAEYVRHLASGDTGGAVTYLRSLRFEQPDCDVWRLIEQVAAAALDTTRKDGTP
jgi:hypothetical protein